MTEIQIMINKLYQMSSKNILPLRAQIESLKTSLVKANESIADSEKIRERIATKLAASEAQLNRMLLIGEKMKASLYSAANRDTITPNEWKEWKSKLDENAKDIQDLMQHQYNISTELETKVEKLNKMSDHQLDVKETTEKDLAMVTEWLKVIESISCAANITNLIRHYDDEYKESVLRCFTIRQHDLDVVIYLPQMCIDEHYLRIERMKNNEFDLERENGKLAGLREQFNRIQALGEKMSGWIWKWFPDGDNVQQKEHDLDMDAIIEPLKEKIDISLGKIQEYEHLQKTWEELIKNNEYRIEKFKQMIEQLEEVRTAIDDIVDKLGEDDVEDVD
jgi:hypothetical protein